MVSEELSHRYDFPPLDCQGILFGSHEIYVNVGNISPAVLETPECKSKEPYSGDIETQIIWYRYCFLHSYQFGSRKVVGCSHVAINGNVPRNWAYVVGCKGCPS